MSEKAEVRAIYFCSGTSNFAGKKTTCSTLHFGRLYNATSGVKARKVICLAFLLCPVDVVYVADFDRFVCVMASLCDDVIDINMFGIALIAYFCCYCGFW